MRMLAATALITSPSQAAVSAATQPNFVVLLIDDGGFSDLGVYGGEARTPNIDALASRGFPA